ncbi:MAG: hypothetical protein KGL68_04845 [Burkholderiales bacterium]|nr:hypothetical protein [Burkholderiales bacterium]
MTSPAARNAVRRALVRFALVAAASAAAATLWAANRPEQGLLLDAQTWRDEVAAASTGPWVADGWYRLVPREQGVEVRAVQPADRQPVPADAVYFRLPGTQLKTGARASFRSLEVVQPPRPGRDPDPSLVGRFSLQVREMPAGLQYAIAYDGRTYDYLLGPRGASSRVRAVADLDGDGRPDFLVDVAGRSTYLLLSTRAQPGPNLPTAEMPAVD